MIFYGFIPQVVRDFIETVEGPIHPPNSPNLPVHLGSSSRRKQFTAWPTMDLDPLTITKPEFLAFLATMAFRSFALPPSSALIHIGDFVCVPKWWGPQMIRWWTPTRPNKHTGQATRKTRATWTAQDDKPWRYNFEFFGGGWLKGTERLLVFPELLISRLLMVLYAWSKQGNPGWLL